MYVLAVAWVIATAACTSPTPLMSLLFDIHAAGRNPTNAPVVRPPRHIPFVPVAGPTASKEYLEMMEALDKAGPAPDWPAIFKKLPKDDEDNIQWMAALSSKLIQPSSGISPDTPQPEVRDLDVELETSGKPTRYVTFSHEVHTTWLRCANCHPAIFKRSAGDAKITMAEIDDGKYCGVCHDKVALAPDGCKGCHKPPKKKS